MPYCTYDDLIKRFPEEDIIQLTDVNGAATADLSIVETAIADADSDINSYLRGRYTLPLAIVPPDLVSIAADLTRYHLNSRPGGRMEEVVQDRYDAAIRKLERLQSGIATLQDHQPEASGDSSPRVNKRTRLFPDNRLPR